jgi:hypothetical protein
MLDERQRPGRTAGGAVDRQPAFDGQRALLAGIAASAAYLVANELDVRLVRYPQRDVMLQGRLLPIAPRAWPLVGLVMHAGFGLTLALVYAAAVHHRLPGPDWLRGMAWANLENVLLWPLTPLIDRHHPAVRDGAMPPLATWRCFGQAVFRHTVYGAVLGLVYGDGRQRTHPPVGARR